MPSEGRPRCINQIYSLAQMPNCLLRPPLLALKRRGFVQPLLVVRTQSVRGRLLRRADAHIKWFVYMTYAMFKAFGTAYAGSVRVQVWNT